MRKHCVPGAPPFFAAVGSFPLVRLSLPVRWSPLVRWSLLVSLSLPVRLSSHAYWPEKTSIEWHFVPFRNHLLPARALHSSLEHVLGGGARSGNNRRVPPLDRARSREARKRRGARSEDPQKKKKKKTRPMTVMSVYILIKRDNPFKFDH